MPRSAWRSVARDHRHAGVAWVDRRRRLLLLLRQFSAIGADGALHALVGLAFGGSLI